MSDYDFRTLNDLDFESLCADALGELLSENHGESEGRRKARFERFKLGRDQGVDARYFKDGFGEVILQCKHWPSTPIAKLVRHLKSVELPKVKRLEPKRYLLALSCPLSRSDKASISAALSPYIRADSDVFGREDLNDILRARPQVEQRHYKLWLHTSAVLIQILNQPFQQRSAFVLKEIHEFAKKYVATDGFRLAYGKVKKTGVVVISGEPGSGKTTLAEQLCLGFVASGYQLVVVNTDISEVEAAFNSDTKQIFYFDDFLGRNYLDAVSGREGTKVARFIRRIRADRTKKFVLTSRTTILNQGKQVYDQLLSQLDSHEYMLSLSGYTDYEKAGIFYNQLWYSDLPSQYRGELVKQHRYKQVIAHKNFTPRLASLISEFHRYSEVPATRVWQVALERLSDPFETWHHSFVYEQDDFGRSVVLIVTFYGGEIAESDLSAAYGRYISQRGSSNLRGRRDFLENLRQLSGSLLQRRAYFDTEATIDLYSPSVGDYVIKRFANDTQTIVCVANALRSQNCITTLDGLHSAGAMSADTYALVIRALMNSIEEGDLEKRHLEYSIDVCDAWLRQRWSVGSSDMDNVLMRVAQRLLADESASRKLTGIPIAVWLVDHCDPSPAEVSNYIRGLEGLVLDRDQVDLVMRLRSYSLKDGPSITDVDVVLKTLVLGGLHEIIEDELFDFIDMSVSDTDESAVHQRIEEHIDWWLTRYPLRFTKSEKNTVVNEIRNSRFVESIKFASVMDEEPLMPAASISTLENEVEIEELFQGLLEQ